MGDEKAKLGGVQEFRAGILLDNWRSLRSTLCDYSNQYQHECRQNSESGEHAL